MLHAYICRSNSVDSSFLPTVNGSAAYLGGFKEELGGERVGSSVVGTHHPSHGSCGNEVSSGLNEGGCGGCVLLFWW
ncbi:hypothetical protein BO82DRAFT_353820 [Aspergillus uvarum CBS 121591]|uniref:Uncharacterized protein n=1 Tax=Aspergillus uvarum CBS 121591 TaxID=1448315 RepID=A0A319C8X1_9EURO|nr:hypothetical protein BO82DRAFT_353820 [Aspergillus uvarum CBS 121591]PYH82256.1 hypothetical protein BO82DRAFT_353820 [Aspergillus uvarum CBS 121591]